MTGHRRAQPKVLVEALGWGLLAALVTMGVLALAGAPAVRIVLVGLGAVGIALLVFGIQRFGLMKVDHLRDRDDEARG